MAGAVENPRGKNTSGTKHTNKHNFWCIVQGCANGSKYNPEKLFLHVPRNEEARDKWLEACRWYHHNPIPAQGTKLYCCEDHFNLEEDAENFFKAKMMGCRIRLKPHVVPHIFDCQPDWSEEASSASPVGGTSQEAHGLEHVPLQDLTDEAAPACAGQILSPPVKVESAMETGSEAADFSAQGFVQGAMAFGLVMADTDEAIKYEDTWQAHLEQGLQQQHAGENVSQETYTHQADVADATQDMQLYKMCGSDGEGMVFLATAETDTQGMQFVAADGDIAEGMQYVAAEEDSVLGVQLVGADGDVIPGVQFVTADGTNFQGMQFVTAPDDSIPVCVSTTGSVQGVPLLVTTDAGQETKSNQGQVVHQVCGEEEDVKEMMDLDAEAPESDEFGLLLDEEEMVMPVPTFQEENDPLATTSASVLDNLVSEHSGDGTDLGRLESVAAALKTPRFPCDNCLVVFRDKAALERHQENDHGTDHVLVEYSNTRQMWRVVSEVSSGSTHTEVELHTHSADSMSVRRERKKVKRQPARVLKKRFQCDSCPASFSSQSLLLQHLQEHFCQNLISKYREIKRTGTILDTGTQHEIVMISDDESQEEVKGSRKETLPRNLCCDICLESFPSKRSLQKHQEKHVREKRNSLEYSRTELTWEEKPDGPVLTETQGPKQVGSGRMFFTLGSFGCKLCGKRFVTEKYLKQHQYLRSKKMPSGCKMYLELLKSRMQPLGRAKISYDKKQLSCEVCHNSFENEARFISHIEMHICNNLFTCKKCHKSFITREELSSHIDGSVRCKPSVKSKSSIKNMIVAGKGRYKCRKCKKSFAWLSGLTWHKKLRKCAVF